MEGAERGLEGPTLGILRCRLWVEVKLLFPTVVP